MQRILSFIIDDRPDNVEVFATVLKMANSDVEFVMDGIAAMEWLDANPAPQLIVLDLNLPGYRGQTIYQHLREHDKFNETVVIITTANPAHAAEMKPLLLDSDYMYIKPVDVMKLRSIAEEIIAASDL